MTKNGTVIIIIMEIKQEGRRWIDEGFAGTQ